MTIQTFRPWSPGLRDGLGRLRTLADRVSAGGRRVAAAGWPRIAAALLLALSIGCAFWAADAVSDAADEREEVAAFSHAEGSAGGVVLLAQQMIDGARRARDLAQRWVLATTAERRDEIETSLQALVGSYSIPAADIAITDRHGLVVWDTLRDEPPFSIADRAHFQRHQAGLAGPWVGYPVRARGDKPTIVPVSWRLEDATGAFAGVVVVRYRPTDLSRGLAALMDSQQSILSIVRLEGEVLARSEALGTMLGRRVVSPAVAQQVAAEGQLRFRAPNVADGRDTLVVFRRVEGANLIAVAGLDAEAALATAARVRSMSVLAAATYTGIMLLACTIGFVLLRTRRLRQDAALLRAGRAELERLHRALPAVVFVRDVQPDGTSQVVYRAGDIRRVTGWLNGELERMIDWNDLVDRDNTTREASNLQVLREGYAEFRWKLLQPDGSWRHMATHMERLSVRPDGGGEVVGYVRDVHAEQAALEREEVMREELAQTLALAPVVVFRAHLWACAACTWRQGRGCYREEYFSRSIQQVTGWTSETLAAAGGLAAVLEPWDTMVQGIEVLKREGAWGEDFRLRRPDGRFMTVRLTATVVGHLTDESMDIVGYIADVTEEREAKARAIGSARLASLGELAAGLAHELKQPLQAISLGLTNTRAAVERRDWAAADKRLDRIGDYTKRAGSVIEHLRRLSRGADEAAPTEAFALADAVDGALALLAGPLRDSGVVLSTEFDTPSPVVIGHPTALEQVLLNLVANARDVLAQLPDGTTRRILLRAAEENGQVVLTVSDNGGGIPDKVLARLFEPFVTTKSLERGTGLGLSICRGLMQHMGGSIEAANGPEGAVFTLRLPAAQAE
jgi:signal transduction histidine kinase